jgi:hypothetical protein
MILLSGLSVETVRNRLSCGSADYNDAAVYPAARRITAMIFQSSGTDPGRVGISAAAPFKQAAVFRAVFLLFPFYHSTEADNCLTEYFQE